MDEIEKPQTEDNLSNAQTDSEKEKRKNLRIYFGKYLLAVGLIAFVGTSTGAGIYSNTLTEWYTAW